MASHTSIYAKPMVVCSDSLNLNCKWSYNPFPTSNTNYNTYFALCSTGNKQHLMVINIVAMAVYQYLDVVKDVPPVLIVGCS